MFDSRSSSGGSGAPKLADDLFLRPAKRFRHKLRCASSDESSVPSLEQINADIAAEVKSEIGPATDTVIESTPATAGVYNNSVL
eukprot:14204253-Alexandrium_andersonii.AAC.1